MIAINKIIIKNKTIKIRVRKMRIKKIIMIIKMKIDIGDPSILFSEMGIYTQNDDFVN